MNKHVISMYNDEYKMSLACVIGMYTGKQTCCWHAKCKLCINFAIIH